jgi:tRNA(Glu) U13 pseudouridine synthase TruD
VKEIDKKYHDLARKALFNRLVDYRIESDISINVEKSEILKAFDYSGGILRSNLGEDQYRSIADTVFETCVRLTRCLFFPIEARTLVLQGNEYPITAEQQLDVLRKNLNKLEQRES